jgi:hypothetical protein
MGDIHPCHGHFQWILCSFALCPLTKSPNLGAVSRASKFHQLLLRSSEFHSSKPDGNRFIKCSLLHFHSVINSFGKTCARNPRNDSIDPAGTLGFTGRLGVPGRVLDVPGSFRISKQSVTYVRCLDKWFSYVFLTCIGLLQEKDHTWWSDSKTFDISP